MSKTSCFVSIADNLTEGDLWGSFEGGTDPHPKTKTRSPFSTHSGKRVLNARLPVRLHNPIIVIANHAGQRPLNRPPNLIMNDILSPSSFDQFLDYLVRVYSLLRLGLKLLDELVGLLFAPFVSHRHQHLLQEVALEVPRFFVFFLMLSNDMEGLVELLFDIIFSHLLEHY